jgi:hypothetical protein
MKKITYNVQATNSNCRYLINFQIQQAISKEQFKKLVNQSIYHNKRKEGTAIFYKLEDVKSFTDFLDEVNGDVTPYKIEVKKEELNYKTKQGIACSFHDYCVDKLNLDPSLLTTQELKDARSVYNR